MLRDYPSRTAGRPVAVLDVVELKFQDIGGGGGETAFVGADQRESLELETSDDNWDQAMRHIDRPSRSNKPRHECQVLFRPRFQDGGGGVCLDSSGGSNGMRQGGRLATHTCSTRDIIQTTDAKAHHTCTPNLNSSRAPGPRDMHDVGGSNRRGILFLTCVMFLRETARRHFFCLPSEKRCAENTLTSPPLSLSSLATHPAIDTASPIPAFAVSRFDLLLPLPAVLSVLLLRDGRRAGRAGSVLNAAASSVSGTATATATGMASAVAVAVAVETAE